MGRSRNAGLAATAAAPVRRRSRRPTTAQTAAGWGAIVQARDHRVRMPHAPMAVRFIAGGGAVDYQWGAPYLPSSWPVVRDLSRAPRKSVAAERAAARS